MRPSQPRRVYWPSVIYWMAGLGAALAIGVIATPPAPPPGAGTGRMFPRVSGPAPDLPTLLYMLGVGSVTWFTAVVVTPLLAAGARKVDGDRRRALTVAIAAVLALFVISGTLSFLVTFRGAPSSPGVAAWLPVALRQELLPWVALVGIIAALEARRRSRLAAIEHERLRAQVAEQRLIALTGQLQPHFLFNTLQAISTLIHRDANAADEMLSKLSDLLRDLLRHRDHVLIPLADELRYARTFLEIAELRFADRLRFGIAVDDGLHDATVPLFILQPLVENALAHGIGGRAAGGRIDVHVARDGERLRLQVSDDGAGLPARGAVDGVGLGNTRERLRAAFGDDQHLHLAGAEGGGTVATVDIPFRRHVTRS